MFKGKRLVLILGLLAAFFITVVSFIRSQYVVPIIMYHSVNPGISVENKLTVSPSTFYRQMHFLKKGRYRVINLENLAELIRQKKKIPAKTVVITFDDGYKDNYAYAFPILKEFQLPANLFLIVQEIGRFDRLSWQEVKEMQQSGSFTIGSHAIGPDPLTKISLEEELKRQIFDSKKILEEKLGTGVNIFSYPEGMFNAKIRRLVIAAGYKAAVATNPGKNYPDNDLFALKRIRISENARNLFVFWVESSGFYTFLKEHRHK